MSDEFTPTTADVAAAYRVASQLTGGYADASVAGMPYAPEFDRWLAAHDEQVRREAQAAILRDRADWVENGTRVSYPHMELADWLRRCASRIARTEPTDG